MNACTFFPFAGHRRFILLGTFAFLSLFATQTSHAQFASSYQTNIISGVTSNWVGDYVVGSNTVFDVLRVENAGALLESGSGYIGVTSTPLSRANNNAVVVSGSGSVWINSGDLSVGNIWGGNEFLTISNAGVVGDANGNMSGGTALVSGTGSSWTNSGDLTIAGSQLTVTNGGTVYNVNSTLLPIIFNDGPPYGAGSSALITGTGSLWNLVGNLNMGMLGGQSLPATSVTIDNGGKVFSATATMGGSGSQSPSSILVTGSGSVWSNSGTFAATDHVPNNEADAGDSVIILNGAKVYCGSVSMVSGFPPSENSGTKLMAIQGTNSLCTVAGDLQLMGSSMVITDGGSVVVGGICSVLAYTNFGFTYGAGTLTVSGGSLTVNGLVVVTTNATVSFNRGLLNTQSTVISNGLIFTVGDGSSLATLQLMGGVHSFLNGLHIVTNSVLSGCGTIIGNVSVDVGATVIANCGGTLNFSGVFTNNGSVISANNTTINFYGFVVNNGLISVPQGYLHFYGGVTNNGAIVQDASTNSWIYSGNGKWEDSTKWSDTVPPAAAQSAIQIMNLNSKTVTIDATTAASLPGSMTISNLTLAALMGTTNTLSVSNTGLTPFEILNGCSVGSGGLLAISNSTVKLDGLSGGSFNIDGNAVLSPAAIVDAAASLNIGNATNGSLMVNGGTLSTDDLTIGNLSASQGSFTVAGGTSLVGGLLRAGVNGVGTISVVGGQLVATNENVVIGYSGEGQMTVSNGSVRTLGVIVGQLGGATGTLTANGGTVNVSGSLTIGDCATNAVGQVLLTGGNLIVSNAGHTAFIDVRNGTLILNSGVLRVDVLVMTNVCGRIVWNGGSLTAGTLDLDPNLSATGDGLPNGWKQQYGLNPLLSSGNNGPNGDPDGDGFSNLQEYLAGTDPTNSASALRITAIVRQGTNILVTWTCVGGHSYVLQSTVPFTPPGYSGALIDTSPLISVPGVGESTTNYLDVGAAYAPILTPPTGTIPTNAGPPSTVSISATGTRGLANASSNTVPVGSLLMLGTFNISDATIQSNYAARNLGAIMSAFSLYSTPFAVGDGTGDAASWSVQRSATGFSGQQIYLLAIDASTVGKANQLGIFTAPSWVFPTAGNQTSLDLADVTDFVVGANGGSLTINLGFGQTYTFSDTAGLNALPGRARYYRVRLAP